MRVYAHKITVPSFGVYTLKFFTPNVSFISAIFDFVCRKCPQNAMCGQWKNGIANYSCNYSRNNI